MGMKQRAVVAVALLVGYFVFALVLVAALIGVALGLVWWLLYGKKAGLPMYAVFAAIVGIAGAVSTALVIAWSLIPRRERFIPSRAELVARDHPRLFAVLTRVAEEVGEPMPRIYPSMTMNASVTQYRVGIGTMRILQLGLPVLATLTVGELRGVFARELGHFHRGDVEIGPWIYRTRRMIERTLQQVARGAERAKRIWFPTHYAFLAAREPLVLFANWYQRVTMAIARAQELEADRISARVVGRMATADGLRKLHDSEYVEKFLERRVFTLVRDGKFPPVSEALARLPTERAELLVTSRAPDPYDPLPALRERLAAIESMPDGDVADGGALASTLVDDLDGLVRAWFEMSGDKPLAKISWAETRAVREKDWHANAVAVGKVLGELAVDEIDPDVSRLRALARVLVGPAANEAPAIAIQEAAIEVLGSALVVLLIDEGYEVEIEGGRPVIARKGGVEIQPFVEIAEYVTGRIERDEWKARWADRGLADHLLAIEDV